MSTLALHGFAVMCVQHVNLEQSIIVPRHIFTVGPCREFLIRRHERRCDVVGEQIRIGLLMKQLNNILVSNNPTSTGARNLVSRDDVPLIVGIGMMVTSDLLTCMQGPFSAFDAEQVGGRYTPWLLIRPSSYFKGYFSGCECKKTLVSLCLMVIVS